MDDTGGYQNLRQHADRAYAAGAWAEARAGYERILELPLSALQEATTRARLMLVHEQQDDVAGAITVGEEALTVVQAQNLASTAEGARLRGVLRGTLRRLREGHGGPDRGSRAPMPLPFLGLVVFIGGIYLGISLISGGVNPWLVLCGVPITCLGLAISMSSGHHNSNTRRTLLAAFVFYLISNVGIGIGYGLASAGIISFGYR